MVVGNAVSAIVNNLCFMNREGRSPMRATMSDVLQYIVNFAGQKPRPAQSIMNYLRSIVDALVWAQILPLHHCADSVCRQMCRACENLGAFWSKTRSFHKFLWSHLLF